MSATLTNVRRKSRKVRPCDHCDHLIQVGDYYVYRTGVFDGYWMSSRACEQCNERFEP